MTQCGFCGAFQPESSCPHCNTLTCRRCEQNHVDYCKTLAKRRIDGKGKTVVRGNTVYDLGGNVVGTHSVGIERPEEQREAEVGSGAVNVRDLNLSTALPYVVESMSSVEQPIFELIPEVKLIAVPPSDMVTTPAPETENRGRRIVDNLSLVDNVVADENTGGVVNTHLDTADEGFDLGADGPPLPEKV
jgi:hypothetical protein